MTLSKIVFQKSVIRRGEGGATLEYHEKYYEIQLFHCICAKSFDFKDDRNCINCGTIFVNKLILQLTVNLNEEEGPYL